MKQLKIWIALACLFVPLFAMAMMKEGNLPGASGVAVDKDGNPLKWEQFGGDYFVMFNSLIADQTQMFGEDRVKNPQGDACVPSSSFDLKDIHLPKDADIERAFLVWMNAVDPSIVDAKSAVDNKVHLKFEPELYSEVKEFDVEGEPKNAGNNESTFSYEYVGYDEGVTTGCSESAQGSDGGTKQVGYYTYRIDITDKFQEILGTGENGGFLNRDAMLGKYTVSDLDCSNHDYYRCKTTMVSAWAIVLVYKSQEVNAKNIYFYNGLGVGHHTMVEANVSGFEYPFEPSVRITAMIAEGDPGNARDDDPENFGAPVNYENLILRGEDAVVDYKLRNECNQKANTPLGGVEYTEVYNSSSSVPYYKGDGTMGFECIGGAVTGTHLGVDVDTFILNAADDPLLEDHLVIGNTSTTLKLSINQDAIFTNFIFLSVDTKMPDFNIPFEHSTITHPVGREKHFCSFSEKNNFEANQNFFCQQKPFYFTIKIQNHGENIAKNVFVSDPMFENPKGVKYVPGTTEMAELNEKGMGINWTPIPDGPNGIFPLSKPYKIADEVLPFKNNGYGYMVRFQVEPTSESKKFKFTNHATISENQGAGYSVNSSQGILMRTDLTCDATLQGDTLKKALEDLRCSDACGGCGDDGCKTDADCPSGQKCDVEKGVCEDPTPPDLTTNAEITVSLGDKSPDNGGAPILIEEKKNDLILGQIKVNGTGGKDKYYTMTNLTVNFTNSEGGVVDPKFQFKNLRLVRDLNGNGIIDQGDQAETDVSSLPGLNESFQAAFNVGLNLKTDEEHFFLVVANMEYSGEVAGDVLFKTNIPQNFASFTDLGTPVVKSENIDFATYKLEKANHFIVSKIIGATPIETKISSKNNSSAPMIHFSLKSKGRDNAVKTITFSLANSQYAKFGTGEGITSMKLYTSNAAGEKVAALGTATNNRTTAVFNNINIDCRSEEKVFLLLEGNFDLLEGEKAKVKISESGGLLLNDTSQNADGLPLYSDEFSGADDGEESTGCSCSVVNSSAGSAGMALYALIALLLISGFRTLLLRKR